MRIIGSLLFAILLVAPGQSAAANEPGPLPPGKPSGVKQAQDMHRLENVLIGVSAVVAGALGVLLVKKKDTSTSAASTTAS